MGASKTRWKPLVSGSKQRDDVTWQQREDIRDLLLIIASAVTARDLGDDTESHDALIRFLKRRREPVPGDGH